MTTARYSPKRYALYVLVLMMAYVALIFWLWPHVRSTEALSWKVLFALSPVLPVACVVVLMARRVMLSDELDQRLHLIALGIATAVVGTASLVGAFLAAAKVWTTDGSVLLWVFPALCFVYGLTRLGLKRSVTGSWDFWGC